MYILSQNRPQVHNIFTGKLNVSCENLLQMSSV